MSSPIARLGGSISEASAEPAVLRLNEEEADSMFDALGSDTAREIVCALADDPAPPSELARRLDTSVQNVHYHLSNLQAAGVVEETGTRYSEKGNEMTVYGPATDPIVLTGESDPSVRNGLSRSVRDWATGVAALGLASFAVQAIVDRFATTRSGLFEPASVGSADPGNAVGLALTLAEPGLLFFIGGLLVFAVAALDR